MRKHFQSAFGCNQLTMRTLDNLQSIDWSRPFLIVIDYAIEHHKMIERIVSKVSKMRLPTLIALDVKNEHLPNEVLRASEIPHHFRFNGQASINELRQFYGNAAQRYTQYKMAHFKYPDVLDKRAFQEILRCMPRFDVGATNYVLNNVLHTPKTHASLVHKANLSYVDSTHILRAAKGFKHFTSFSVPLFNELNQRGHFLITTAKIESDLAMRQSGKLNCTKRLTSLVKDSRCFELADRLFAIKLVNNEVSGIGKALSLCISNRASQETIIDALCQKFIQFVSEHHNMNSVDLKRECENFMSSISPNVVSLIQSELKLLYCAAMSFSYFKESKFYASAFLKTCAVKELDKCAQSKQRLTNAVMLLLIWRGDVFSLNTLVDRYGGKEQCRLNGSREQQGRYKQLMTLYRSRTNIIARMKLIEVFPHSEATQSALDCKAKGQSAPSNITKRYMQVARKLQNITIPYRKARKLNVT